MNGKEIEKQREQQAQAAARELAAAEKFEKRTRGHRHHWPFENYANGEIKIGRCECGEPYPEEK